MFTRRKSRNINDTAYTGVNQNTISYSTQPSSGALAAALSIGNNNKKQSNNNRSVSNTSQTRNDSLSSNGSLLKRSSRNNIQNNKLQQPNRRFSNGSYSSSTSTRSSPMTSIDAHQHHPVVYDIDDSFNDSYLDEITEESTKVYLNNKANLQDLKLSHNNQKNIQQQQPRKPVKMIKKYIPSPTGIKVIEVPESTYEKELARSNSLRSNSISRSNSLRGLSNKGKISRSTSLQSVSKIAAGGAATAAKNHRQSPRSVSSPLKISEDVDLEESLGKSDEKYEQQLKYKALQKEIEEEKKLAKEIEAKRKEYEKLKQERLQNAQKLKDLEAEVNSPDVTDSTIIHNKEEVPNEHTNKSENVEDGNMPKDDFVRISIPVLSDDEDDKISKPHLSVLDDDVDANESKYSELEIHEEPTSNIETSTTEAEPEYKSLDPNDTELGIINQYNLESTENLVDESKPLFDPSPAITDHPIEEESKETYVSTLQPPVAASGASSKSSVYSSESAKKPIKSAMKTSKSTPISNEQNNNNSVAHQAYLSLTTAENTRLNSKLSNPQLLNNNDFALLSGAPGGAYPQFTQLQNKPSNKRLSQQTLRKPQQQSQSQPKTSLRPQSIQQEPVSMSNRSLRHSTVQPIAPHPALQPNYVSPSKVKAQELYAKAQARPRSDFAPLKKKSSFTREQNENDEIPLRSPDRENEINKNTKTTLRGSTLPPQNIQQLQQQPVQESKPKSSGFFKSRFADSDDEGDYQPSGNKFKSRFNDSDEDLPKIQQPNNQPVNNQQFTTLRQDSSNVEKLPKEKKKFGKLRKLFGSRNN
ncbi:unnamed protein product [Candida verbasci]|uniref:Uncharacterized protein n=1 Tax=Candida verbasci TaxID=1227364 RepID=A0A9W4TXB9_9ASCO|nr:unnamed protein product [Candida verbasci]